MKKWMTKALLIFAGVGVLAFMEGCYPDNTLTVSQTDVVVTGYNDSVDFQSLHTYYMPDTIFVRREDTTDQTPVANQQAYLDEIAKQMSEMGYQRFTLADTVNGQMPDVELIVSALEKTYVVGGWYYPYYPGWSPWFPGWGWYYPPYYYPSIPWYSEYKTGTLLVEMVNKEDYDVVQGDTVSRVYWNGALNGILEGSNIETRTLDGIDQMFKQSPEIKTSSK
ncbi:DUF4136 domain-containing protein [Candidatus Sulfidibacterium hydrothermale]|uniref:DUF4136 domain-containing protein n=1 Tax=Candidatus Sulfidibacterium hydrothermale TaxID=2875962 RepID=UPI001F0A5816|nr:DUF4136 domain-containing protein [Candidatus Sulfidibacterium hydrothermale]UBM61515.1 DUF4136 domain-containing protein [Candidatus Sulfidibacterium hydrothermale]